MSWTRTWMKIYSLGLERFTSDTVCPFVMFVFFFFCFFFFKKSKERVTKDVCFSLTFFV